MPPMKFKFKEATTGVVHAEAQGEISEAADVMDVLQWCINNFGYASEESGWSYRSTRRFSVRLGKGGLEDMGLPRFKLIVSFMRPELAVVFRMAYEGQWN
jgi:hypothetical protein